MPFVAGILIATAARAHDSELAALRTTLLGLQSHAKEATIANFGARAEVTTAKHQLRDWIETQLGSMKDLHQAVAASSQINQKLKAVNVDGAGDDQQNLLGRVAEVRLTSQSGLLIVRTGVGIMCQYDESAYAFKRVDGGWSRVWESEQNDYAPGKYTPQNFAAVHVWRTSEAGRSEGALFVMTLGNSGGCASSWRSVYYRVWRVDGAGSTRLLDKSDVAFLRADTYIVGRIVQDRMVRNAPVDVLIEFTQRSIDGAVHSREAIRHYRIKGDRVDRVAPVALSPRDFVDEWLTRPWDESAAWSFSPELNEWHRKLHTEFVAGELVPPTMRCQTSNLWQVTFQPHNAKGSLAREPDVHFLVRWDAPHYFAMVDVSEKPSAECDQKDPEADAWRTLFNTQDWRQ